MADNGNARGASGSAGSSAGSSTQQIATAGTPSGANNSASAAQQQNPIVGTSLQQNPIVGTSQNSIVGTSQNPIAGTSQQPVSIAGTPFNAISIVGTPNTQQPSAALSSDTLAANAFQNASYSQFTPFPPSSLPLSVVTSQLEGFYGRYQDAYRGRKNRPDRRRAGDWPESNAPPYGSREQGATLPLRPAYDLTVAQHRCSGYCEECPGFCPFRKTEVPPSAVAYSYGQPYAWPGDSSTVPKYPTGQEQISVPSSGDENEEQRRARKEQLESVRVARYKTQRASERELHLCFRTNSRWM